MCSLQIAISFPLFTNIDAVSSRPLVSDDIAKAAVYMLEQPPNISIKALDVVPTGQ